VKLFRRGNRAVALTDEGTALAASLSELFGLLELALDRATAAGPAKDRCNALNLDVDFLP